ncbi:MAG: branched-chain amino acid ABC transporter permease [Muribaculaceae bacterium]|nr:branched-chain amino acid ABC transporter permease [Muribaculaceae bacterium]
MKKLSKSARSSYINYGIVLVFFVIFQSLLSMGKLSSSFSGQLIPICTYVIMALALNLVVGMSGELSLGHAGFMSVGAFSGVVVSTCLQSTVTLSPLRLAFAIVAAALIAALAGTLIGIPVLRLQGDYLAIVTLAFGEIIKNVLNCLYVGVDGNGLHLSMKDAVSLGLEADGITIINGPMGALGIQKISTFASAIILVLIVLFMIQNLVNSRAGRAIKAIRDNRIAAESCGVNIMKYKMMAFVLSAAMAGAAGALYALNYSTVVPKKFDFNTSILILVFVVLGGIGNLRGSIIAAALLTVLPEMLRQLQDYRMLVYAIVLILVMILTNNQKAREVIGRIGAGIAGKLRHRRQTNE